MSKTYFTYSCRTITGYGLAPILVTLAMLCPVGAILKNSGQPLMEGCSSAHQTRIMIDSWQATVHQRTRVVGGLTGMENSWFLWDVWVAVWPKGLASLTAAGGCCVCLPPCTAKPKVFTPQRKAICLFHYEPKHFSYVHFKKMGQNNCMEANGKGKEMSPVKIP